MRWTAAACLFLTCFLFAASASAQSCTTCHGAGEDPAPPIDTLGNSETSFTGVGAHQSHQGVSNWHAEVACEECHIVPRRANDSGHNDTDLPAELAWGPLATADGAVPAWDGATCSVYCHGSTLPGGGTLPVWTEVDDTWSSCESCHTMPPPAPHVVRDDCHSCHPGIDAAGQITDPDSHIDGVLQVLPMDCMSCHGADDDPAPPLDTMGNTGTSFTGVGAHQAHQGASDWHAEMTCDECHLVPATVSEAGHVDSALPAEMVWGPLASADGATPSWDGMTCSVYCHGSTLPDAGSDPLWTVVDGTYSACQSCHGMPPAAPHDDRTDCHSCHPGIDENGVITDPASHVDGVVQVDEESPVGGLPARTALLGAAPNPFNPSTKIAFELAEPGPVRLRVFDAAGRLVATLLDEIRPAGDQTVTWGGRDDSGRTAAAGVYLYRLETGNFAETRRIVLVK